MVFNFAVMDSLDAVPAEFRFVYSATPNSAGKFEVQEGAKALVAAFQGNTTALEAERGKVRSLNTENATRRTQLTAYESLLTDLGITPEDPNNPIDAIKAHVATLQDKVKGGDAFKGNLTKIQDAANKRVADITAAKDAELKAMQATLEEHLIDKEVLSALTENKARQGGRVLLPHVKSKLKVVKDAAGKYGVVAVDEQGNALYNSAAQPMTVKDVVGQLKQAPEYAFAFESDAGGGTGHKPGSGQQPIKTGTPGAGELTSTQKIAAGLTSMTGGRSS